MRKDAHTGDVGSRLPDNLEGRMKASLTKVSLALLSAVFVLGCQDQGPVGPEGLEPQFAKAEKPDKNCDPTNPPVHPSCKPDGDDGGKPNPASPFYSYTFTPGGITSDVTTNPDPAGATGGDSSPLLQGCCDDVKEELILSGDIAALFEPRCFAPGQEVIEVIRFAEFGGDLRPDKHDKNQVRAVILLKGLNGSGTADIPYRLVLVGNATSDDDDIFPPELDETTTVTFTNASMEAQSKSERNKGACSGGDDLAVNIVLELTGTDTEPDDTPQN